MITLCVLKEFLFLRWYLMSTPYQLPRKFGYQNQYRKGKSSNGTSLSKNSPPKFVLLSPSINEPVVGSLQTALPLQCLFQFSIT